MKTCLTLKKTLSRRSWPKLLMPVLMKSFDPPETSSPCGTRLLKMDTLASVSVFTTDHLSSSLLVGGNPTDLELLTLPTGRDKSNGPESTTTETKFILRGSSPREYLMVLSSTHGTVKEGEEMVLNCKQGLVKGLAGKHMLTSRVDVQPVHCSPTDIPPGYFSGVMLSQSPSHLPSGM